MVVGPRSNVLSDPAPHPIISQFLYEYRLENNNLELCGIIKPLCVEKHILCHLPNLEDFAHIYANTQLFVNARGLQ